MAKPAPTMKASWKPSVSAVGSACLAPPAAAITSSVREFAIVARIASPSAPPTCCDVLLSLLASPASWPETPLTAAIVIGTNAKPSPIAASSEAGRMSEMYVPSTETWEPENGPGGQQQPADQRPLEADAGHEHRGQAGRHDDPEGQRQVGEAGLQRAVAEHVLHVERHEEEHREQRHRHQQRDHVGARQRPVPEDPERDERALRAALDQEEAREEQQRDRDERDRLGRAPAGVDGVDERVDEQ